MHALRIPANSVRYTSTFLAESLHFVDATLQAPDHMSHSLNSLQGVIQGIISESSIGVIKGDTKSFDHSSYALNPKPSHFRVAPTWFAGIRCARPWSWGLGLGV